MAPNEKIFFTTTDGDEKEGCLNLRCTKRELKTLIHKYDYGNIDINYQLGYFYVYGWLAIFDDGYYDD